MDDDVVQDQPKQFTHVVPFARPRVRAGDPAWLADAISAGMQSFGGRHPKRAEAAVRAMLPFFLAHMASESPAEQAATPAVEVHRTRKIQAGVYAYRGARIELAQELGGGPDEQWVYRFDSAPGTEMTAPTLRAAKALIDNTLDVALAKDNEADDSVLVTTELHVGWTYDTGQNIADSAVEQPAETPESEDPPLVIFEGTKIDHRDFFATGEQLSPAVADQLGG